MASALEHAMAEIEQKCLIMGEELFDLGIPLDDAMKEFCVKFLMDRLSDGAREAVIEEVRAGRSDELTQRIADQIARSGQA
jgi:hypothetical protein